MLSAYGMLQIANRYCESWINSIKTHQDTDDRIKLFAKFIGLHGPANELPYTMFRHYLYMLKVIKVKVSDMFQRDKKTKFMISYSKILKALKEQMTD